MSNDNCSAEDKTPGIFSWRELITQDLEGSTKFYTDLLGWATDAMEMQEACVTPCSWLVNARRWHDETTCRENRCADCVDQLR